MPAPILAKEKIVADRHKARPYSEDGTHTRKDDGEKMRKYFDTTNANM